MNYKFIGELNQMKDQKATVIIDLGNGEVKAKVRVGVKGQWKSVSFPSVVVKDFDGGFILDNKKVVVGIEARQLSCKSTGSSSSGKVNNSLFLLTKVLQESVGFENPLTIDVIFGCPSIKEYGEDIKAQLVGLHTVKVPKDINGLGKAISQSIRVVRAIPQLEGYQAHQMISKDAKIKYIVDIGNRTVLITGVNQNGGIASRDHRKQFDSCGVQSICSKLSKEEVLVKLPHAPRLANPDDVMDYLLDSKFTKDELTLVSNKIKPYLGACLEEAADWVAERFQKGDSVTLIGGGARLPGIVNLFKGSKVIKNSSWATVDGLLKVADTLIAGVK